MAHTQHPQDSASQSSHRPDFTRHTLDGLLAERLTGYVAQMEDKDIRRALASQNDDMLITVLSRAVAAQPHARAITKARARGIEHYEALLNLLGGTVPATEVAHAEGVTVAAIRKRVKRGRLVGRKNAGHLEIFGIQLDADGRIRQSVGDVLSVMPEPAMIERLRWLATENRELDGSTPMAVLDSKRNRVFELARYVGEQGGG